MMLFIDICILNYLFTTRWRCFCFGKKRLWLW